VSRSVLELQNTRSHANRTYANINVFYSTLTNVFFCFWPFWTVNISIGQYVDTYWPVNQWTGQYPILAYTTWHDLNQSQPHISIRGITKIFIRQDGCRSSMQERQDRKKAALLVLLVCPYVCPSRTVSNSKPFKRPRKPEVCMNVTHGRHNRGVPILSSKGQADGRTICRHWADTVF